MEIAAILSTIGEGKKKSPSESLMQAARGGSSPLSCQTKETSCVPQTAG